MQNGPGDDIKYCNVDFDLFESSDDFAASCSEAGGNTVKASGLIECSYAAASPQRAAEPDDFVFSYENLLDCVSDSCEDGEVTEKIAETLESTAEELERRFVGATCSSRLVEEEGAAEGGAAGGEGSTVEDTAMDIKDDSSAGKCHSLFAATAIGGALMAL